MPTLTNLAPQDPIPDGHVIVLMRRAAEDLPHGFMIELIVHQSSGAEQTSVPTHANGELMTWDEATEAALALAAQSHLPTVYCIDRTAGPPPQADLQDSDLEDGEPGPDMRDDIGHGAPRRFF
jgi:hypothetical protein